MRIRLCREVVGVLLISILSSTSAQVLTVNGLNADYGTTHVFIDETQGDSVPLTILFSPGQSNVTNAEVFSNLNRRQYATNDANGDGVEDGILPPDGNAILMGDDGNYYKSYSMTPTGTPGQYTMTLYAQRTGVYRLTARYQVLGSAGWNWYSTNAPYTFGNRRDFSIVVSPKKALNLVLYELAVLSLNAQGTLANGTERSTFADLYNGPGSRPYDPITNRFNLAYMTNLGVNWLWLEPVHPIGVAGGINSPYCVKNFFAVSPWMSKASTRSAALQEFTNFVAAADAAGVNVMMDIPFDHTAHDVELDAEGITQFAGPGNPGNWKTTDLISNRVPQFFSMTNDYWSRASSAVNIAVAPDRGDFGKWNDVSDVFYGVYAALVNQNPQNNSNYLNTSDWFDYSATGNFDQITRNVWRYFSDVLLFWLDQTGCTNGTPATGTAIGIDGIRADFAEGMPPQWWEYTINKCRSRKWDFVFLAESLNGGAPTYRSSRDFDIVNDSVLYSFRTAANAADYQTIFNLERTNYGECLMLWNTTSHDAGGYYKDPFQALIRCMVAGAIDGAPMIFYGQELGTSEGFGFSLYTTNGTELVPNLYTFNSLQPICAPANRTFALDQLYPLYAAIGQARQSSPALRSANRYFLAPVGGPQPNIFAVAKYQALGGLPNFSDVVFAFVNLDSTNGHQFHYGVNVTQNGSNIFGITASRMYNFKNIAAYDQINAARRNQFLISGGVSGTNLLAAGLFIQLNPVPATAAGWTNAPYEAHYFKLYDVTPPPTPEGPATPKPWVIGNTVTFTWPAVTDQQGGISGYHVSVGTAPGASNVFNTIVSSNSVTLTGALGATLYASVIAINNAGIEGSPSTNGSGTILLDPGSLVLSPALIGNSIALSWPGNLSTNFTTLYSSTHLGPQGAWSPVPGNPIFVNQQWQTILSTTNSSACFYRLQLN